MSGATLDGVDAKKASLLAEPGDADLDLDVCDVRLTSVIRAGDELWVRGTGGFGRLPHDAERSTIENIGELSLRASYIDPSEGFVDAQYRQLCQWRDEGAPLRVCGATDRLFTFSAPNGTWLSFPRALPEGP